MEVFSQKLKENTDSATQSSLNLEPKAEKFYPSPQENQNGMA